MTEKTLFMYTNGFDGDSGDGAAAYTEEEFRGYNHAILAGEVANAGVLSGVLNELAVSGSTSPLSVATGRAIVNGFHYQNLSSAVSLTVTTPSIGDTGGRVVVRVNLTAANTPPNENTGRVRVITSADGTSSIPAMTQTAATTWDIPLATFVIDTSGNIWTDSSKTVAGVSDARQFSISPLAGMVRLRETILTGVQASIDWKYIQSDLNHLLILFQTRSDTIDVSGSTTMNIRFNGDTGGNYDYSRITGNNSALVHALATGATFAQMGRITGAAGVATYGDQGEVRINNYRRTTFYKSVSSSLQTAGTGLAAGSYVQNMWGWWKNTAAINRVTLLPGGDNFATGSVFTLYGIR